MAEQEEEKKQFSVSIENDKIKVEAESDEQCWNCFAEGNFMMSMYSGKGNKEIQFAIPEDVSIAMGTVRFSYDNDRCNYPLLSVYLNNDCYIETYPRYMKCNNERVLNLYYTYKGEMLNVDVYTHGGYTAEPDGVKVITNEESMSIIAGEESGTVTLKANGCEDDSMKVTINVIKKE